MALRFWTWKTCGALLVLAAPLMGCDDPYALKGQLTYGRCGMDGHLEAYPLAHEERKAYGCKSDTAGYLESASQGDKRGN